MRSHKGGVTLLSFLRGPSVTGIGLAFIGGFVALVLSVPMAARPGPALRPAPSRAGADPGLKALYNQIKEKVSTSSFVALDKKYLPIVARHAKLKLPASTTLKALVVKDEDDNLLGAFLGVLPARHKRCSEEAGEMPVVFWLDGTPRLITAATEAFQSTKPAVHFPSVYPKVPFFVVKFKRECQVTRNMGNHYLTDEVVEEVWSLTRAGAGLVRRFESYLDTPAGTSETVSTNLKWIAGKRSAFYLAAILFSKSETPVDSGGEGPDKGTIHRCRRVVTVYSLTRKGGWTLLSARRLAALKRGDAALRRLKGNARGKTEAACDKLDRP